jgi:hypothetical protein
LDDETSVGSESMRIKAGAWPIIGKVLAVCIAGVGIALLYRLGLANIGGALILSAIIVSVITFVRSGALSVSWLRRENSHSIRNAARLELAKTFICGALGIDAVRLLRMGYEHGVMPATPVTVTLILTVAVLSAMGTGLYLTRAFAAYLCARRR